VGLAASIGDLDAPTVQTAYGPVTGFTSLGVKAFRGIPYAASPTGDLRFRPPQAPQKWKKPLDASAFGPSCLQIGSAEVGGRFNHPAWNSINVTLSSEDCLFLNVYAPSASPSPSSASGGLPVMVYFHAGEFRFGSSNDRESNWPFFAHGTVLLVTANVRLGIFGFGALKGFKSRDPSGSAGNYGMQDQREVLKWVQRNIAAFGGDPARVTMFGESSGGSSVGFHLTSTKSAGLFSQAILESPGLTQSKTWAASETNTEWVASILTGAGSPGCSWPAVAQQQWIALPGLVAAGHPIGIALSLHSAQAKCAEMPSCSMVYQKDSTHGLTTLFGGGTPGNMSYAGIEIFNISARLGKLSPSTVLLRVSDPASSVECLLDAHAGDLVALNTATPYDDTFETDAAAPTEDGVELDSTLAHRMRVAVPKGVALLGGSNLDEGTEFMSEAAQIACNASAADFQEWCTKQFGPDLGPKVPPFYSDIEQPAPLCREDHHYASDSSGSFPEPPTSVYWQAAMRAAGDSAIMCRTRDVLQTAFANGDKAYWYYFTVTPTASINEDPRDLKYMGAFHGAEVPFVFGDTFELLSPQEQSLSQAMGCYWTNFAASGNPNSGSSGCISKLSLPEWPLIGKAGNALELSNTTIRTRTDLKEGPCHLFAQYP